jgi:cation diffusion facilitator family transporter
VFALCMLLITRGPPDRGHPFGHGKAEYFSAGFEGLLILGAALVILAAAFGRFIHPQPLESPGWGLLWSAVATAINFIVARVLAHGGRRFHSVALDADSRHLMTDVWTSIGVIAAVALVAFTGWLRLDPIIAAAVGIQILVEAWHLLREAVDGLMDRCMDPVSVERIEIVFDRFRMRGISFAELRTRRAGAASFVQVKVRVPGDWSVRAAHGCLDDIESSLVAVLPGLEVTTHLEPLD